VEPITPKLYFIAHRMNVGSPVNSEYNHVDNGMEALEAVLNVTGSKNNIELIKGFECDVRLTSDNELVVLHDGNAKSMTKNKYDKNIGDMKYKELQSLEIANAGFYYGGIKKRALILPDSKRIRSIITQKLQNTTVVPKAFEMFEYLASKGYSKEIVLELKEASDKNRDATIELVNAYKNKLNIIVKSYDAERTVFIGEKTGVKIGLLEAIRFVNKRDPIDAKFIRTMPFDFYSILWTKVNNKLLSAIVENGKDLYIWTIDSAAHFFAVLSLLERFYDKFGSLPKNTHLISNIPILLDEYVGKNSNKNLFANGINKKYSKLFIAP